MTGARVTEAAVARPTREVTPARGSHEREAETAAAIVAAGGSVTGWSFSAVPPSSPPPIRRSGSAFEPRGGAPPSVDRVLAGGGRALETETRSFMEAGFGRTFADVRVHDDAAAAASAQELGAHAYTSGRDVAFGAGRYAPSSPAGRRLLAHELSHVVQQGGGANGAGPVQRYTAYSADEQARGESSGWLHPDAGKMRVSDDGQMAVDDKGWNPNTNKRAWTTPALIAASNGVLGSVGALAQLRPKSGGRTIFGTAPDGTSSATLTEIEPFRPGGGHFSLASDCGTACRQIIGSGPRGTRDVAVLRREAQPGSAGTGGAWAGGILGLLVGGLVGGALGSLLGPLGTVLGAIGGAVAGAYGGSRLGRALARRDPVEAHEEYSSPETYHGGAVSTPEVMSGELYQRELGGATREEALQRYAALSDGDRDEFDRKHGINRYARPRVGEGITIGTEYRMPGYADPHGHSWNFHYAADVIDSGHDYMTLESAAGWGIDDWIFYMYGPPSKGQSFQEEQAATGSHGTRQTSLVVLPEFRLDVEAKAETVLRTASGPVTLPAGQKLHILERRTPLGGAEEVRVRVSDGPNAGAEGWLPAGALG
jgi:hypothetical protein